DAQQTCLVTHVVLKDNVHVRVEVNAALGHHPEHLIVGEDAMLDLLATGAYRGLDGLRRVRVNRNPWAFASPQAAFSCSCVIVCLPPSRMLADAKILTTSARSAFSRRTSWRISSGLPLFSLSGRIAVSRRGPGMIPRSMASRTLTSEGSPTLCTVVKPAIKTTYRFSAVYKASAAGE